MFRVVADKVILLYMFIYLMHEVALRLFTLVLFALCVCGCKVVVVMVVEWLRYLPTIC